MQKRCILIFPKFHNIKTIDLIREKYDPLHNHIRPHITLVFPFTSNITTTQLKTHLTESLASFKPFNITLQGITGTKDHYLFLNLTQGKNELIELHDRLYTGILKEFLHKELTYIPHLTVGRIEDDIGFKKELIDLKDFNEIFQTQVEEISVEIIDENQDSIIEIELPLKY